MVIVRSSLFVLALSSLIYTAYRGSNFEPQTPCSPDAFPARCYNVSQTMCETIWTNSAPTCKEWVKKFDLSPGRLISPIVHQCQLLDLDAMFTYSRKSTPECDKMSTDLKDWKRRNL